MAEEKIYEQVDCEGLCTSLSEELWLQEVNRWKDDNKLTEDDLYEWVWNKDRTALVKQVHPHFATTFFAIREGYMELIEQYKYK